MDCLPYEIIEHILSYLPPAIYVRIVRSGDVHLLQWFHYHGCKWDEFTCEYAAKYGQLECLKYAHENGCPWDEDTVRNARDHKKQDCLKYALENGCKNPYARWF